jgi:hypothetical protein
MLIGREIIERLRSSPFAKTWWLIANYFPMFALRHSPFKFLPNGVTIWGYSFGWLAYVQGDRVVTIPWAYGKRETNEHLVYLSKATLWLGEARSDEINERELEEVKNALLTIYSVACREAVVFT